MGTGWLRVTVGGDSFSEMSKVSKRSVRVSPSGSWIFLCVFYQEPKEHNSL